MKDLMLSALMFGVSAISGMLGIGVAFAAIPILGIHSQDLVHEVQPIALFLNGVTAMLAAVVFARAGYVEWPRALVLAAVCTVFAPVGSWAAQYADERTVWTCYFVAMFVVIYLLISGGSRAHAARPFVQMLLAAAPIAALSGFLGVGPGFLLVPVMIHGGISPRRAAAMNAVAVTPASFVSLVPHIGRAVIDPMFALPIVLSASCGALAGGYLASRRIPEKALRGVFIGIIVVLAGYKATMLSGYGAGSEVTIDAQTPVATAPHSK